MNDKNPALEFLQQIKKRQSVTSTPIVSAPQPKSPHSPTYSNSSLTTWNRIEIVPGLEIHVREDFSYPHSLQEQQKLLKLIDQELQAIATKQSNNP